MGYAARAYTSSLKHRAWLKPLIRLISNAQSNINTQHVVGNAQNVIFRFIYKVYIVACMALVFTSVVYSLSPQAIAFAWREGTGAFVRRFV